MPKQIDTKYIFVSGGVISGLGKGTTTASIALLLKASGYKISTIKADMYLNIDAGTMNPIEHGEVFVTDDGLETDQDIGNYERFLSQSLGKHNYMTMGQVYWEILNKERSLQFHGKTVQGHIHIPEAIIDKITEAGKKDNADIVMIEVGGTVGEYQNMLFFEAIRRFKQRNPNNVFLIHLVYLITPSHLGEMKSKPAQASVYELYRLGLSPDMIICRSDTPIDSKRKETLSFNTGVNQEHIFSAPNIDNVYTLPLVFKQQELDKKLLKLAKLKRLKNEISQWKQLIQKSVKAKKQVRIAILGKYFKTGDYTLNDAYLCVLESIKHASWHQGLKPIIEGFDVEKFENPKERSYLEKELLKFDGVIVPQGWGSRGVEGKIAAIKFVRENKIPFLGLCFGMQMAVIEYSRNVLGLKGANTTEADPKTSYPVIYVMPDQEEYLRNKQYGGTIRLGAWPCKLIKGSIMETAYKEYSPNDIKNEIIHERHRHRYEVNNEYKKSLEKAGLVFSGTSPDGKLAEAIELPREVHPFFVASQFHPEYKSWVLKPHPIFMGFIKACNKEY